MNTALNHYEDLIASEQFHGLVYEQLDDLEIDVENYSISNIKFKCFDELDGNMFVKYDVSLVKDTNKRKKLNGEVVFNSIQLDSLVID